VAFIPKFASDETAAKSFPPIFGTGFVVHEDGLIATNDHVISCFPKIPQPDGYKDWPVAALFFIFDRQRHGKLRSRHWWRISAVKVRAGSGVLRPAETGYCICPR
jgi:hypothetical protein